MVKRFFVVFFAALLVVSCAKKQDNEKKEVSGTSATHMLKIGDITVGKDVIEKELQGLPERMRELFTSDKAAFERFLDEYANKEILYKEAMKKGIDKDKELERRVEYFKKVTAIQLMLEKELSEKAKVTDSDIQKYYKENKDEFIGPDEIKLSHILVKTDDAAKKVIERLKKGEDFAKLAKELSEDKESAAQGGDLGSFPKGKIPPEFADSVKNLKKGEISQPIKTKFGYHIVKVTDIKKGVAVDLNSIKGEITKFLAQEKQKKVFDEYVKTLRKSYKVEINSDVVDKYLASVKKDDKTGSAKKN